MVKKSFLENLVKALFTPSRLPCPIEILLHVFLLYHQKHKLQPLTHILFLQNTIHQKKALEFLYLTLTVQVEICYHSNKDLLLNDNIGHVPLTNLLEKFNFWRENPKFTSCKPQQNSSTLVSSYPAKDVWWYKLENRLASTDNLQKHKII